MTHFIDFVINYLASIQDLVASNILLAVVLFCVLATVTPVSALTVFYASIFPFWKGISVISVSYLSGIVFLMSVITLLQRIFKVDFKNITISQKLNECMSMPMIVLAAMSIPFVPLVLSLQLLRIERYKIIAGVYLGGLPMMLLTFYLGHLGKGLMGISELRYLMILLLVILLVRLIYKILRGKSDEKQ